MNAVKVASVLMMLGAAAAPVAGQGMGMAGQSGGAMDSGMMQMCHAMSGGVMDDSMMQGGGAMEGHAGMMAGGSMEGMSGMQHMDRMSGMMSMMQGMGLGPAALLGAADRLQLSPAQKSRLGALAEKAAQEHQGHMQAIMAAHQDGAEALKATAPDLDAYQRTLEVAADHMVQAHMAMTRATIEARGVLTEEQRGQVQEGLTLMGSMMCGAMGGGEQQGAPGEHAQHHR